MWKLVLIPDLSKVCNVVNTDVYIKKDVYNAKIKSIEDKIPHVTKLATRAPLNVKINEVKGEIPSITNLTSNSALTAVENNIPSVSNLVKIKLTKIRKIIN